MAETSPKEIKLRIRSMESTRQITRAMEMVSAAKLRHTQETLMNSRPYYEALRDTIQSIIAADGQILSVWLQARPVKKRLYLVIAGDRGLAGGFNSNVLKPARENIRDPDCSVLPIGKKAAEYFHSQGVSIWKECCREIADVSFADCSTLAGELSGAFLAGEVDEIHVIYTRFLSALSQIPVSLPLLPLTRESQPGILFETDCKEDLTAIVSAYLSGLLYCAVCESRAAETAARRIAMHAATRNADEMIDKLRLRFNRVRQTAITQEITQVVAGS